MRRRRTPPAAPALALDDVICGRSAAFVLAPGSPLRGAGCLVCHQAAGDRPVIVFAVFQFRLPAERCGAFPAASWLIHDTHPPISDDQLASVAIIRHHLCLEVCP